MWVKVCGLTREADVEAAVEAGVDAVGFVLASGSPRRVEPSRLASLAGRVPAPTWRVAVFAAHDPSVETGGLDTLQAFAPLPDLPLRRLAVLRDGVGVESLLSQSPGKGVAAVVLDAYHPALGGGTGRLVDLALAAELRARLALPLIVAGGLTPGNVCRVVEAVRPWGVDVSTGVETSPGVKDRRLIRAFVEAARSGEKELGE